VRGARGEEVKRGERGLTRWSRPGAGARFIGPGRRSGGGEEAGGSGVLIPVSFEGVKGE
jgi:hypothetical protein